MVLYWRRYGRVGGCRIIWGCSSVGRAPALQAGGHGFESHHLHGKLTKLTNLYLENRIQIKILKYQVYERDIQDIRGVCREAHNKQKILYRDMKVPTSTVTLDRKVFVESIASVIHRPAAYFMTFASQMIRQSLAVS